MKILTDFETVVDGDSVTIKCKIIEGNIPGPTMQNTVLHMDDKVSRHISHIQMSNHGYFIKIPNQNTGVAVPNEQWVLKVARVIEPKLSPPDNK
jgi:hypothetical protein